jgi:hypothetical protein
VGKGGFKVLNHAALASSYDRGNHFAYGHFKNKHNEKVQHLEAVSTVKPQKEKREYFYDKRNTNESNPFNKKSEGTTMFYVVDGYGTRKAVDIKFSNETVQKLFEERMMNSKVYKKEISLERFNAVLKKIEAYMKELASIDPERLKSKVYGEKESLKLNNVIDKFTDLFYSLRK